MATTIPYNQSLAMCLAAIYAENKDSGNIYDTWDTVYFDGEKYTCFADLTPEIQDICRPESPNWQKFFDVNIFDANEFGDGPEGTYRWGIYALELVPIDRDAIQTNTSNVLLSGPFDVEGIPTEDDYSLQNSGV